MPAAIAPVRNTLLGLLGSYLAAGLFLLGVAYWYRAAGEPADRETAAA